MNLHGAVAAIGAGDIQYHRTINETGTTILLVEQNARMALQIAHRAYVLETGSIVFGHRAELMNSEEIKSVFGRLKRCL